MVEAEGGDALTMRRVAEQIGVSASSLYGYVANKEELVQLVLERIIEEIPFPPTGGGWQDMLRQFARRCSGFSGATRAWPAHPRPRAVRPEHARHAERILAGPPAASPTRPRRRNDLGSLYVGASPTSRR